MTQTFLLTVTGCPMRMKPDFIRHNLNSPLNILGLMQQTKLEVKEMDKIEINVPEDVVKELTA